MFYSNSFTCAAASLTGHASNVTGAAWTITTATAGDGLAHQITVRNDSATDHSAKTIVLVGTDANGNALTQTIAAPGTSATVTSSKYFKTLTSATPSATIGADTFDIGWAATAHSPAVVVDPTVSFAGVGVAVSVGGTINYDVQHAYQPSPTEDSAWFNKSDMAAETTTQDGNYSGHPISGVRVDVNSHTSGTFTLYVAAPSEGYR